MPVHEREPGGRPEVRNVVGGARHVRGAHHEGRQTFRQGRAFVLGGVLEARRARRGANAEALAVRELAHVAEHLAHFVLVERRLAGELVHRAHRALDSYPQHALGEQRAAKHKQVGVAVLGNGFVAQRERLARVCLDGFGGQEVEVARVVAALRVERLKGDAAGLWQFRLAVPRAHEPEHARRFGARQVTLEVERQASQERPREQVAREVERFFEPKVNVQPCPTLHDGAWGQRARVE